MWIALRPLAALVAVLGALAGAPAALAAAPPGRTAQEILDHTDDLFRGRSSHARLTMKVVTAQWSRELSLEVWSQGKDRSLVRILSPQKERGTATLKSGENVWNYLPKVARVVKVPASMMGGSWMGSHFTNDDLVKESRMAEDYSFQKTFEGTRDGQALIELTLTPRPEAAVVWGRVVVTVRASDLVPLRILYYDEDLALARTTTFSDPRPLGGRTLPAVLRIVPADRPAESTEITYEQLEFDLPLPDSHFSLQNLEKQGAR